MAIVYEHVVVLPYSAGKFGFFMYEQFALTVLPQAVTINTQHTPNLKNNFNKLNMDIVSIKNFNYITIMQCCIFI